jgi:hypothetical protein
MKLHFKITAQYRIIRATICAISFILQEQQILTTALYEKAPNKLFVVTWRGKVQKKGSEKQSD